MRTHSVALWPAVMAMMTCTAVIQPVCAALPMETYGAIRTVQGTPQRQAAEQGLFDLSNRLANATGESARIFAVADYQQLRHATIGAGFEVNLVDPHVLLAGRSIRDSTFPGKEWRFVVMVGSEPVGLITVASVQGRWKMVSAGASELAKEVVGVVSQYAKQDPSAQLRFIRSQQGVADLIEVTEAGGTFAPRYVPLLSARIMLKHSASAANAALPITPAALAESQIVPDLRASVQRGLSKPSLAH